MLFGALVCLAENMLSLVLLSNFSGEGQYNELKIQIPYGGLFLAPAES